MASPLRRSHSTPGASSLAVVSNHINDDSRWSTAKPSQVYSRFVRDSFFPAHVQLQRSRSEVSFGLAGIPDKNLLGPSFAYRREFGLLQHPARFKPRHEVDSRIVWRYPTPRRIYGDYHWPHYRRYIADEWNCFDYGAERGIDSSNAWRVYAPIYAVPYHGSYPNYVTRFDSYAYGPVAPPSSIYWRDYAGWRNYMNGLIAGTTRRGTPFWRRVYSSIYPPLWHLSPLNYYYTHGYY